MFESELNLQTALNEAGAAATGECLSMFDTDGGKIVMGGRKIARSYVGEVASDIASVAAEKEGYWNSEMPTAPPGSRVKTVSTGVDGTCALFIGDGWRQVMVGTISFYDEQGERLGTTYVANAPETGKGEFFGFSKISHPKRS